MELPINHLLYWIKGIPAPYGPHTLKHNELGTIETMEQDGWSLKYDRYGTALEQTLPQRIKITRDDLKVTLIIKEWLPLSSGDAQ